jgi:hypothetical protein
MPEGIEEDHEGPEVRIEDVMAKILPGHHPYSGQKTYRLSHHARFVYYRFEGRGNGT